MVLAFRFFGPLDARETAALEQAIERHARFHGMPAVVSEWSTER
jgi:hypothetical protein